MSLPLTIATLRPLFSPLSLVSRSLFDYRSLFSSLLSSCASAVHLSGALSELPNTSSPLLLEHSELLSAKLLEEFSLARAKLAVEL
jgi:hypothetical protein